MRIHITSLAATAVALSQEFTFNGQLDNAESLKTEYFSDAGIFMINEVRKGILAGHVSTQIMDILDKVCDKCSDNKAKLSDVLNLLIFPDLTDKDGSISQTKLDVFMSNICLAVNCRDTVAYCPQMIADGMSCSTKWMVKSCSNSCGCKSRDCPPLITDEVIEAVISADEMDDAEHSDEIMDVKIEDAIKLLDPTSILGQFDQDVRTTLQSQMCNVPNADTRIVAANDLLRVLVDSETAGLMDYISQKLPMYLAYLPEPTKKILANEVICNGYTRSVSAESCLSPMLSLDNLSCDARLNRWTYDNSIGQCVESVYDGCFLTENRFRNKDTCENKCQYHIKAAVKVNERKVQQFVASINKENLRHALLAMLEKEPESPETTEALLAELCDPETGKVLNVYRDKLCDQLYGIKASGDRTEEMNKTQLDNLLATVNKKNMRSSLLEMLRKKHDSPDSTDDMIRELCNLGVTNDIDVDRKPLCDKLYQLNSSDNEDKDTVQEKNPALVIEKVCPTNNSERTFCVKRPRGGWQKTCESAGCCFDKSPTPNGPRNRLLWKDFCFKKIEKQTTVTLPIKQIDETDEEHSDDVLNCNVNMDVRQFCVKFSGGTLAEVKERCQNAGCCFEKNGRRLHPKWRQSCYKGN